MSLNPFEKSSQVAAICRRRNPRISFPVPVRIAIRGRLVEGVVRDISMDQKNRGKTVGISMLHYEPLTVGKQYECFPVDEENILPESLWVEIRWCRYFEDEAFISGGELRDSL